MARRMIYLVACLCMATAAFGQRVTRSFNDVSMSEALKWLNERSGEYNISFLYNELEDFRVTTTVKNKSLPDAIQQLIGFYPIKMTVQGKDIAVECPLREATRYKGTVLDETGLPLPYANVALLSPRDSMVITGGVTNESGLFVIPCDQSGVLARITYVGYRPTRAACLSSPVTKAACWPASPTWATAPSIATAKPLTWAPSKCSPTNTPLAVSPSRANVPSTR